MNKMKSWYIYLLVAVIGVAAFLLTEPEKVAPRKKSTTATSKRGSSAKLDDQFTEEDYKANFSRVAALPKNVFMPLVMTANGMRGDRLAPNEIPMAFTGGKEKWKYTGTAIEDGIPQALVENMETGEVEFLKTGQAWKSSVVRKITPISLVLEMPGSEARSFDLMRDPVDEEGNIITPNVRPLAPNTQGVPNAAPGAGGPSMNGPVDGRSRRWGGQMGSQMGAPGMAAPAVGATMGSNSVAISPSIEASPGGLGGFVPDNEIDNTISDPNPGDQQ